MLREDLAAFHFEIVGSPVIMIVGDFGEFRKAVKK
jgi:hypothetical protein